MSRPVSATARYVAALALALVAACSPPPPISPQDRADQQARAACRARADAVYAQRNRGSIYGRQDDRLTPFSTSYNPGITTTGLGDRFDIDQMIANCVSAAQAQTPDQGAGPTMEPVARSAPAPLSP